MDTRSSSLIVGLYGLAAVALAALVGLAFYSRESRLEEQLAREAAEMADRPRNARAYLSRNALTGQEFLAAQSAAEIERLRGMLDEKNKLLEERAALLRQRTAEYRRLQREFDAAATVALQALETATNARPPQAADEPPVAPPPPEESSETTDDLAAPAEDAASPAEAPAARSEAAALREELNKARLLENALSEEVEHLQAEVLGAEMEINRIREEARTQTEQLLADERLLRDVASETLVRIGEPAIPAIVALLRDENPAVRRWAALLLADLGPAAPAAIGPLMDALADRDEAVRTAAAQALRAASVRE